MGSHGKTAEKRKKYNLLDKILNILSHGKTAGKMKKYDRNMGVGEFGMLTSGMGMSFTVMYCANPQFRQWVFDRLERGVSPEDIHEEYLESFRGVPRKKTPPTQ